MKSYHLSLGYNDGAVFKDSENAAWDLMASSANGIVKDPMRIAQEAVAFGAPMVDEEGTNVFSYAKRFQSADGTSKLCERDHSIILLCSADSGLKGHVRRAFCRLLMAEMHQKGIEINLHVI